MKIEKMDMHMDEDGIWFGTEYIISSLYGYLSASGWMEVKVSWFVRYNRTLNGNEYFKITDIGDDFIIAEDWDGGDGFYTQYLQGFYEVKWSKRFNRVSDFLAESP